MTRSRKDIEAEHYGSHFTNNSFDYYCVAHGPDYEPKYLQMLGEACHSYLNDYYCADSCRICPVRCPITPCPLGEDE
jgi:hypothetical protein